MIAHRATDDPSDDPIVRPGTAGFQCIAQECGALCCRNPYRVDLDESEAARLSQVISLADVIDERTSMTLLKQASDACVLLSDDLRCTVYDARPHGCRDYPFRLQEEDGGTIVVRDLACPGFIGPPMSELEYQQLLVQLQSRQRAQSLD